MAIENSRHPLSEWEKVIFESTSIPLRYSPTQRFPFTVHPASRDTVPPTLLERVYSTYVAAAELAIDYTNPPSLLTAQGIHSLSRIPSNIGLRSQPVTMYYRGAPTPAQEHIFSAWVPGARIESDPMPLETISNWINVNNVIVSADSVLQSQNTVQTPTTYEQLVMNQGYGELLNELKQSLRTRNMIQWHWFMHVVMPFESTVASKAHVQLQFVY